MNYEDKIKKVIVDKGGDDSLFVEFLNLEKIAYINKEEVLYFSIWDFIQNLVASNNSERSIHEFSDFCNKNLSYKGCLSWEKNIVDGDKMLVFSKIRSYLGDTFPEFGFLTEVRYFPVDFTKRELDDLIIDKEKQLSLYIKGIIDSLEVQVEDFEKENIIKSINKYVMMNIMRFREKTSSEISRLDVNKVDPNIIKSQVVQFIDAYLNGNLDYI